MLKHSSLFLVLAMNSVVAYSQVAGSLANFDVVNDTNEDAHGFEIELHDIQAKDITSVFGAADRWPNMVRYGSPTVAEFSDITGSGVKITYKANYDNGVWSASTPSGTLPVNPSDSCWPLGSPNYGPNYPCDHFGVSASVSTPNVKYSWLVEDKTNPGTLKPVLVSVPNPVWTVTPVAPINGVAQPPKVNVAIAAPDPITREFGDARWVKVTATGTVKDVALEDLVAENDVVKNTQTQLEWQLLQVDMTKPGSGQIDLTGVALDAGATGVVYRFEFYEYTGAHDPETNEALPKGSDTPGIEGPDPGDLGKFIVAQNAAVNFDGKAPAAPAVPIAPLINAAINTAVVDAAYSQVIDIAPGIPGDVLEISVQGLPAGLAFDPATNTITGMPSVVGVFPITIDAKDTTNNTHTEITTQIEVLDAPIVFDLMLEPGAIDFPYHHQLSVKGGYGAITYTIVGDLPAGLALVDDTISGTPTAAGSSMVTIEATDSLGNSKRGAATLDIGTDAPACSGNNEAISAVLKKWLNIAGGIPNGGQSLRYAPQDATTFTSPLKSGIFKVGQLVNYSGTLDAQHFCVTKNMTVTSGLDLNPIALAGATVGAAYPAVAVTPIGGVAPYTIAVEGLPDGLTFDGVAIQGKAKKLGKFAITTSVSDANGGSASVDSTLLVNSPIVISGSLSTGQVAKAYAATLKAVGGASPLTWKVTGAIPGVTFNKGVFKGKPTKAGKYNLIVKVTDKLGKSKSVTYSVVIANLATCTAPAKAKTFTLVKSKITAVTPTSITVGGKVVKISCASVTWSGSAGFKVGRYATITQGFSVGNSNTALKVTVN